jgi:hypothetical protein
MPANYSSPKPDITKQLQGNYYGLVYLALATVAYASEGKGSGIPAAIVAFLNDPTKFKPLPDPTNNGQPLPGYWKLDWGPAIGDNSNAIFLVSFRQGTAPSSGGNDGAPYFFAVVNRGTDTSAWFVAVAQEILEDLGAFHERLWSDVLKGLPNVTNQALPVSLTATIAHGTSEAVTKVTNFTADWKGQPLTIAASLAALLTEYPGTPVVVTGHSLGGCLTQVVAAYLAWQLYGTQSAAVPGIIPNPFAPPTAGNAAFAQMYGALFPHGNFWFNTFDLVPHAWVDLPGIDNLWGTYSWPTPANVPNPANDQGPACPFLMKEAIKVLGRDVPGYSRPPDNLQPLNGSLPTPEAIQNFLANSGSKMHWQSWEAQLLWQHFPPCYYSQMKAQVSGLADYPYIDTNAK